MSIQYYIFHHSFTTLCCLGYCCLGCFVKIVIWSHGFTLSGIVTHCQLLSWSVFESEAKTRKKLCGLENTIRQKWSGLVWSYIGRFLCSLVAQKYFDWIEYLWTWWSRETFLIIVIAKNHILAVIWFHKCYHTPIKRESDAPSNRVPKHILWQSSSRVWGQEKVRIKYDPLLKSQGI